MAPSTSTDPDHVETRRPGTRPGRAFTLIELIVVMALIVILIGLAVPAFRFLSGGRSVEGASNIVSAALASARADAIGIQKVRGVMLYKDPATTRTGIAFLEAKELTDWAVGGSYTVGMYVRVGASTTLDYYVCINKIDNSSNTDKPGTAGGATYWRAIAPAAEALLNADTHIALDAVPLSDRSLLPVGIGLAGVTNVSGYSDIAVVLFDAYGTVVCRDFVIAQEGILGTEIPLPTMYSGTSQVAMMLYDQEDLTAARDAGTAVDTWLNANGTSLLVNRYNGTIVRGE